MSGFARAQRQNYDGRPARILKVPHERLLRGSGAANIPALASIEGKYVEIENPLSAKLIQPGGPLKITIFGLTLSSSWGNGHATPYRAILRALHQYGVNIHFYEKDVAYYSQHRDFISTPYCELKLYSEWDDVRSKAIQDARESDVVIVGSYAPDGARASNEVLDLDGPLRVFYDLDTPITLKRLENGPLEYLEREQIPAFDLYLSFTGGWILSRLEGKYGARMARALYGCVDPDVYFRVLPSDDFRCVLSYLGTHAPDRQEKLDELFLEPARRMEEWSFLLAGSLYPFHWTWGQNVRRYEHVAPDRHAAFYSSSRATLNITRGEMAESGYCPSGRFFEAAACGTPILTDWWEGLDSFFDTERDLHVVRTAEDVLSILNVPEGELRETGERARCRTLGEHTGECRAAQLLEYCEQARSLKNRVMEATA
jgi:spore maturation protein CgeB